MRVRRCAIVLVEPHEDIRFDLGDLVAGGTGVLSTRRWLALVPHLGLRLEITVDELLALSELPQHDWIDVGCLQSRVSESTIASLLGKGLAVTDGAPATDGAERDRALRSVAWEPLTAVAHQLGRWEAVDSGAQPAMHGFGDLRELLRVLGTPPPAVIERGDADCALHLSKPAPTPLDELLARRVTCRNFDATASIDIDVLARLLWRVFGAQAAVEMQEGHSVLKKTSPSAGGLHPTEAHLLAQRVDGAAAGLYHYHPIDHALRPIRLMNGPELAQLAMVGLAGQAYFADAPALLVLSCRFERSFWKYRQHSKAHRAMMLDVGHLSQTLYLSATEWGLGAFVTSAVNDIPLEQALGLDPLREGVIAICGVGARAPAATTLEFDPLGAVWGEGEFDRGS